MNVREGETVWKALQEAGIKLGECGGLGKCGKCKIKVLSSLGSLSEEEKDLLNEAEIREGIRLACRTTVHKNLVVYLREPESEMQFSQILVTGDRPQFYLDPLLDQRTVALPPSLPDDGTSNLDRIRHVLGPEYRSLTPSLHCLRTCPQRLKETQFRGAAVFHENCLMTWLRPEKMDSLYGMVFDIGTTTLVGRLVNLVHGSDVAVVSCLNKQSKFGTDVIARHQYVKDNPNGLENLYQTLVDDLNHLIRRLARTVKVSPQDILIAVAAGNTTMQHLLLGLDPSGIAEAPFAPVLTDGLVARATDVGLELGTEALLYMMPTKSGYIGGDLLSVILASGAMEEEKDTILALDFGTNGEIFLGNRNRLMTCSAAAGPALEGARISHGMIAAAGAIEDVTFEKGNLHYQVIGNIKPKGVCGSGLVQLVAVLLELGVIDHEGLIRQPEQGPGVALRSRIVERDGVHDFLIASAEESYDGRRVRLTQKDVRELQLAKGAIAAGVTILMNEMGIEAQDIDHVYLAGALGNYISPDSAMSIGLIPPVDPGIVCSLGNAASTGASIVLLSKDHWRLANTLNSFIDHIELSSRLDFNEQFIEKMDFPQESLLDVRLETAGNVLKQIRVEDVMTRNFPTVSPGMSVKELEQQLRSTGHHGFPVLEESGRLLGCVTIADLDRALQRGNEEATAGDIATRNPFLLYPDQTLHEVLQANKEDYGRLPVVDRKDRSRLLGVLRRHDIIRAYRTRVE
ncbi:MAG: ASKHA domain-containing protein [Syntrophobacteria bacterium]